jgi:hypothetical protein
VELGARPLRLFVDAFEQRPDAAAFAGVVRGTWRGRMADDFDGLREDIAEAFGA